MQKKVVVGLGRVLKSLENPYSYKTALEIFMRNGLKIALKGLQAHGHGCF